MPVVVGDVLLHHIDEPAVDGEALGQRRVVGPCCCEHRLDEWLLQSVTRKTVSELNLGTILWNGLHHIMPPPSLSSNPSDRCQTTAMSLP